MIRKHDPEIAKDIMDKGAASTTKKIVQSSLNSMRKMMKFDEALK